MSMAKKISIVLLQASRAAQHEKSLSPRRHDTISVSTVSSSRVLTEPGTDIMLHKYNLYGLLCGGKNRKNVVESDIIVGCIEASRITLNHCPS